MAEVKDVEDLKQHFSSKAGMGERLPNPKDVSDKASYYLKSGDTYIKHRMVNGSWMKEVVNDVSEVIFQKV